jgi:hypothetical protein
MIMVVMVGILGLIEMIHIGIRNKMYELDLFDEGHGGEGDEEHEEGVEDTQIF